MFMTEPKIQDSCAFNKTLTVEFALALDNKNKIYIYRTLKSKNFGLR